MQRFLKKANYLMSTHKTTIVKSDLYKLRNVKANWFNALNYDDHKLSSHQRTEFTHFVVLLEYDMYIKLKANREGHSGVGVGEGRGVLVSTATREANTNLCRLYWFVFQCNSPSKNTCLSQHTLKNKFWFQFSKSTEKILGMQQSKTSADQFSSRCTDE